MTDRRLRILIVNQYFPPDTSATAVISADVSRALAGAGHSVTILAGRPSYAPTETRPWRLVARESWEGCVVERVGSTAFGRTVMLGRAFNYLSYLKLALWRAMVIRADVIIAMTDPPIAAVIAAAAAGVRSVPFVYNIRDLHPEMAVASGMIRPGLLTAIWGSVHRWALRRAARIIVLGDDMKARVVAAGASPDRVVVVRDGADAVPPGQPSVMPGTLTELVRRGFAFTVMHAGNVGFAGAWDTLLAAARLSAHDIGFVFVGEGAQRAALETRSAGQGNVRWLAPVAHDALPELMAAGDVQVVTVRRGLEGLVVPSKLYSILAAGRPVLAVASEASDVSTIVREAECGWIANPDHSEEVARVIASASERRDQLAQRAAAALAASTRFDRAQLLDGFVREVEAVGSLSCSARRSTP